MAAPGAAPIASALPGAVLRPLRQRAFNSLVYWTTRVLLCLARTLLAPLPLRAATALGRPLGQLAWLLARPERRRALANLGRVHPELSRARRGQLVRQVFRNLGRSAMECLVLRRVVDRHGERMFSNGSRAALESALARGRGVIFVTAHYGNWELMAATVARVAPVHVLARGSYDPRFTQLIARLRSDLGVRCIWIEQRMHLRQATRVLERGEVLGVLLDHPPRSGSRLSFLGVPAPTSLGAAALASRTGAAVVAGFIERLGPDRHRIDIQPIDLRPIQHVDVERPGDRRTAWLAATRQMTAAIEQAVTRRPDHWLWCLDRWRYSGRDTPSLVARPHV